MRSLKNILFLFALTAQLYSCQKSTDVNEINNSSESIRAEQSAASASNMRVSNDTATNFGVLSANRDIPSRLTAASNLTAGYVRETILLSSWNGNNSYLMDTWLQNGYKVLLNINNSNYKTPFPTDLVTYESNLRSVLNVYASEVVVIENEEANQYQPGKQNNNQYHLGSLADYINELTVAVKVCEEKGLAVTNGGLTPIVISSLYNYYIINNKPDSALWLKTQMGGVSKDTARIARADSLITAYRQLDLSYVNLHWYEPNKDKTRMTGVLNVMINYLEQQTGKKVITNETGLKTDNPSFVTQLMQQWDNANSKYAIFFDENGIGLNTGAYPLTTAPGILLPNGVAFKNYNLTH